MAALPGWETFFEELERFVTSLTQQAGTSSEAFCHYAIERLEVCIVNLSRLLALLRAPLPSNHSQEGSSIIVNYCAHLSQLLRCLRLISLEWQGYMETIELQALQSAYRPDLVQPSAGTGRPRFDISQDQLEYLSSMSFTWTQIASMLGVSRMTIYRRRVEFGMNHDGMNTNISDEELAVILQQMRRESPNLGERMVIGRLRSMGFKVARARVRDKIRATDPIQTALRWTGQLARRQPYSVPGPNSLWHIDGHHKLVRWRFVTHCAIDGYSRLVMFLKCSSNNKASTVYDLFLDAIREYGLPSRIRCDQGRENIHVVRHMLHHRGIERRSALVGSSVHNQRVERLWRDLHRCATQLFYRLFYYMEYHAILDPINEKNMFALHYVFAPRISKALRDFKDAWNHHGVRTERGMTPNQLFTSGMLKLKHSGLTAMDFFDIVDDNYGVDEEGLVPPEDDDEGVEIPRNTIQLSEQQLTELTEAIDPLGDSDDYGMSAHYSTWNPLFNNMST